MTTTHLKTAGMACEACSALIEMNLERLPGVIAAHAYLDTGLTTVIYDPLEIDEFEIADEIHRSGFRARVTAYPQFVGWGAAAPRTSGTTGAAEWAAAPGEDAEAGGAAHLHAVHIRTTGLRCAECTALVKDALGHVDGVVDVAGVRSLGLTSILFDETRVDAEAIVGAIRDVGFGAEVVR